MAPSLPVKNTWVLVALNADKMAGSRSSERAIATFGCIFSIAVKGRVRT
ncbi:MAG: hypothetical protein J7545_21425 [Roseofilum sp. SBFL]|nr:hypothetical protein [Roseofilum sp. SBFL]MBP0044501.1 hypothetical protein [Roseofilum sp. SBFL]